MKESLVKCFEKKKLKKNLKNKIKKIIGLKLKNIDRIRGRN